MYDPERITFFAKTDARGKNVPFGIKAKDRTRHVYVIGKTGMGKSTLLENMAVQDIRNGEGFAFIDPHGQTAETLLNYIPPERMKDVLYFAPHDMDFPVSFNVMEDVGPDKRHLVVSGLMSVFEKIWVDAWSARMAYILQNTLLALLEYPDATLLGVNRMLSDKKYRDKVVANIKDPAVKSFWVDEFAKYNERYMQEAGDAIKNKIGQFTANPLIRNIIGQPKSSFDIRKIMDEKKIIIMNLSKGLIGETNANLLGSMLTTRVYLAAMSRADVSAEEMKYLPNFYFYVDEFQSFANATFANILSEARKYKLNLTIAHQYIEQMEEDVRNAVFGNVGTTIAFRVGPFDAEVLETVFAPKFMAVDLVNLGFAQIYLTLMIDGIGSSPFSAVTLPPLEHKTQTFKDQIVEASRQQFARPRAEVEEAISVWHAPIVDEPRERPVDKEKKEKIESRRPTESPVKEKVNPPPAPHRTERPRDERSREKRPASDHKEPNRDADSTKRTTATKSMEELRAVLRQISKSETPDKPSAPADLKSALASVLPATPATGGEVVIDTAPSDSESELDPKKLERMMRVKTDDRTPFK
jgi:energy-coupling factor transporter ATP-binding protein EcfA2